MSVYATQHTHPSQLIDAGVDVVTISKHVRHSNPNITSRIYAGLFRPKDDEAAGAINDALANPGGSK